MFVPFPRSLGAGLRPASVWTEHHVSSFRALLYVQSCIRQGSFYLRADEEDWDALVLNDLV